MTDIDTKISELLSNVGIPSNKSSYRFLVEAIVFMYDAIKSGDVENENDIYWSELWAEIAENEQSTQLAVQKGISSLIKYAFDETYNSKLESLLDIMGERLNPKTGRVKPSVFIITMAKHLIMEDQKKGENT